MTNRPFTDLALIATAQHGVITRAQAAAHGFNRRRIATLTSRGLLEEVRPTVLRLCGSPPTWRQRLIIATLGLDGAASHRSGGRLHRLDGFRQSIAIEVTVPQRRQRHSDGIVAHRSLPWEEDDLTIVDGILVTTVARTLCDLGAVVGDDAVERALDDAIRRGVSERWILRTLERVERPGPSGTASLRRVLGLPDRAGVIPDSYRERMTERLLLHPDLHDLVRQHQLRGEDGAVVARFDLAVVQAKVGIEFHSDQWHYGPRRGRGDRRRDLAAARLGWEIVYLDNEDHRRPDDAVAAVLDVVSVRRRAAG